MDIELGFISKLIETEEMRRAVENKITPKFLYGKYKPIYEFMVNYYKEYRKTPTIDVIKREYSDFKIEPAEEPLEYYIDELRNREKYNIILNGIQSIADDLEGEELDEAETKLYQLASKVSTEVNVTRDINYVDNIDDRIERYLYKKKNRGIDGIPLGVEPIDNITGGAHKGELITILAQPGTGKTWFSVAIIVKKALEEGYRTLFITKEMEPEQIALRMDGALLGYNYDELRRGLLGTVQEEKYFNDLKKLEKEYEDNLIISGDDGEGTITQIVGKIDEHNPELVVIDGSYLIIDEEGGRSFHERALNIARGLKRVARRSEIPVYNSTQANRSATRSKAPTMEEVGFSYGYSQDSDVILSLFRGEELKEANKLGVSLAKVREGADMGRFIFNWDFQDMKTFGSLAEEITPESQTDDEDEDVVVY